MRVRRTRSATRAVTPLRPRGASGGSGATLVPATFDIGDEVEINYEDDEEDYRRMAPKQQRKDWGAINYKKALCPDMVAGRKCPHGAACTYAHSYDELRVVEKPGKPHVCVGASTASHELAPPEYWQMGTFADASRQGPYLWARLAKAPRHAAVDPSVTYLRRGNQQKMFVTEWVTNVARLRPATQGCPRGVLVAEE